MPVGVDGFAASSAGVARGNGGWLFKTTCVYHTRTPSGTPAAAAACTRNVSVSVRISVNFKGIAAPGLSRPTAGCREGGIKY
jgi:hypothetical protein